MAGKNGNRTRLTTMDKCDEVSLELGAIHAQLRALELATEEGGFSDLGEESHAFLLEEARVRCFKLRERVNVLFGGGSDRREANHG